MFVSTFCLGEIKAKNKVDYSDAVVYTIDDNGELVESDESIEFLLSMLESSDRSTYVIPGPEYTATRITDIIYSIADPKTGANIIDNTITLLGGTVWGIFSGSILNVITKTNIGKAVFNSIVNTFAGDVSESITSKFTGLSYLTSYMYKKWSDYYDVI